MTLNSLIPTDQDQKIAALKAASQRLGPALNPPRTRPAPDDQENIAAIQAAAEALSRAAGNATGEAAEPARHLSGLLRRLASADAGIRAMFGAAIVPPLIYDLDLLRKSLAPNLVTMNTLPQNLVRDWVARRHSPRQGFTKKRSERHQRAASIRNRGASRRAVGQRSASMNPGKP